MCRRPSVRAISGGSVLAAGLLAARVAAAIDLSGTYVSRLEVFDTPCTLTFVQSGTAVTITGPCTLGATYTFDLAGTVDPATGAFVATGVLQNLCETPGSVTMTGTGDGETFTGIAGCSGLTSAVAGTKCANGVLDASEDCEDGNTDPGDCCSPTCSFDAPSTACAEDGNACTRDVCDGAGHCEHPADPQASGLPCATDFDVCTDDVCDAGGQCTHPPNAAPCDDFNPCTGLDACADGTCVSGAVVPECVGSIDLTGDWILTPPFFLAEPKRHFEQRGVVLAASVPGGPVYDGWVNSATGEFESRTFITYLTAQCGEVISATATGDGGSFAGMRTFHCGLDGDFGPYPVTGQRCVHDPCLQACVPGGLSCTVADAARLVVREGDGRASGRWHWVHAGPAADFGDPTANTDYRLCIETPGGLYAEAVPHGSGWRATRHGFRYRDDSGAIRRLSLSAGPGKASLLASLDSGSAPAPPLPTPVRVRLIRDGATPACFEAPFASPTVNEPGRFRATE